jgi:hypothetical protein
MFSGRTCIIQFNRYGLKLWHSYWQLPALTSPPTGTQLSIKRKWPLYEPVHLRPIVRRLATYPHPVSQPVSKPVPVYAVAEAGTLDNINTSLSLYNQRCGRWTSHQPPSITLKGSKRPKGTTFANWRTQGWPEQMQHCKVPVFHSNPTKVPRHDKTSRRTKAIKQANSKIGNEKLKYQLPEAATTLCTH